MGSNTLSRGYFTEQFATPSPRPTWRGRLGHRGTGRACGRDMTGGTGPGGPPVEGSVPFPTEACQVRARAHILLDRMCANGVGCSSRDAVVVQGSRRIWFVFGTETQKAWCPTCSCSKRVWLPQGLSLPRGHCRGGRRSCREVGHQPLSTSRQGMAPCQRQDRRNSGRAHRTGLAQVLSADVAGSRL